MPFGNVNIAKIPDDVDTPFASFARGYEEGEDRKHKNWARGVEKESAQIALESSKIGLGEQKRKLKDEAKMREDKESAKQYTSAVVKSISNGEEPDMSRVPENLRPHVLEEAIRYSDKYTKGVNAAEVNKQRQEDEQLEYYKGSPEVQEQIKKQQDTQQAIIQLNANAHTMTPSEYNKQFEGYQNDLRGITELLADGLNQIGLPKQATGLLEEFQYQTPTYDQKKRDGYIQATPEYNGIVSELSAGDVTPAKIKDYFNTIDELGGSGELKQKLIKNWRANQKLQLKEAKAKGNVAGGSEKEQENVNVKGVDWFYNLDGVVEAVAVGEASGQTSPIESKITVQGQDVSVIPQITKQSYSRINNINDSLRQAKLLLETSNRTLGQTFVAAALNADTSILEAIPQNASEILDIVKSHPGYKDYPPEVKKEMEDYIDGTLQQSLSANEGISFSNLRNEAIDDLATLLIRQNLLFKSLGGSGGLSGGSNVSTTNYLNNSALDNLSTIDTFQNWFDEKSRAQQDPIIFQNLLNRMGNQGRAIKDIQATLSSGGRDAVITGLAASTKELYALANQLGIPFSELKSMIANDKFPFDFGVQVEEQRENPDYYNPKEEAKKSLQKPPRSVVLKPEADSYDLTTGNKYKQEVPRYKL